MGRRQPIAKHQKLVVKELYAEKFELLRPVWDDYVVPLGLAGRRGNSDPTWTQLGASALYLPGFSASQDNEVFFSIQMPHMAAQGGKFNGRFDQDELENKMDIHVHWMPSTTNTGNCLWQIDHWVSVRGTAYSDDDVVTTQKLVAASGVITETITEIVEIPTSLPTNWPDSTCIVCRLSRQGTDVTDTFTGVALGISVDCHMLRYRLGSQDEYGDTGNVEAV